MSHKGSSAWAEEAVGRTSSALSALADPARAEAMSAYMRGQFPFLGIATPARRAMSRGVWRGLAAPTQAELADAATLLWALPEREYQYAACDLLARHQGVATADFLLATVAPLIVSKSWWDTVDALRGAIVGPLLARHRELTGVMREWAGGENRWLVRSAIIHQLGYGQETDADLLFELCARRASDTEFFIAKAIGWALRSHGYVDAPAVRTFVKAHPELTPLARREALKRIGA